MPATERESVLPALLADRSVSLFIGRHTSGDHEWFIKERWELLVRWLALAAQVNGAGSGRIAKPVTGQSRDLTAAVAALVERAATAGYQVASILAPPLPRKKG